MAPELLCLPGVIIRGSCIVLVLATAAGTARADDRCGGSSTAADLAAGVLEAIASSSSSSSSSTSAGPAVAACETAGGYGECAPPKPGDSKVRLELGTAVRSFASPIGERDATIQHDHESFTYRVAGPEAPALDTAVVAQLRVARDLRYGFYVGAEAEGGAVTTSNAHAKMMSTGERGTPEMTQDMVTTVGGLAIAGIGRRLGPVDLGIESAAGFRAVTYHFRSVYHACIATDSITAGMPVLEGRARAAVWVSPSVSIGATYGRSVVDESALAGLYVHWSARGSAGR